MTKAPGTYALVLQAETAQSITVGALGTLDIQSGWYVYVGSAFGPGGLRSRVRRHVRGDGALHWHIDYLRAAATVSAVWYTHDEARRECEWAATLRDTTGARTPFAGFGASDCACPSHLSAFDTAPPWAAFRTHMREQRPDHAPIQRATRQQLSET